MNFTRRKFLGNSALLTAAFVGLRQSTFPANGAQAFENQVEGYGPLLQDPNGILNLPEGFSYRIISRTGETMADGLNVPSAFDGMAAFAGPDNSVIIVRNHELTREVTADGAFGDNSELFEKIDARKVYDVSDGKNPHLGGTTTLVYDPEEGKLIRQFMSLAGTCRNCAGGLTPWGTWITCEETLERKGGDNQQDHGYNFEVPATADPTLADPVPLKAMGRFNHEAIAVDPKSGVVYQTEDRDDGLLYRFIPNVPGQLAMGGKLQALMVVDQPSADTRNWPIRLGRGRGGRGQMQPREASEIFPQRKPFAVQWIDLDEIEAPRDDLRRRGNNAGAAMFARGEGCWYGNDSIYFACTNGGAGRCGQIFRYTPSVNEGTDGETNAPGMLELFAESPGPTLMEYCDNLTVSPWGDIIVSEDGAEDQFIRGVTPEGKIYTIGYNCLNQVELTGVCFAPNHPTMFINIQRPGLTFAITGPWERRVS